MVAGALGSLVVGRLIDEGHGRRSVLIAYGMAVGVILLKGFGYHSVPWPSPPTPWRICSRA